MSRKVRKVPRDWQHPKQADGSYQPMFDQDYASACEEWKAGYEGWKDNPESDCEYWVYYGSPPEPEYYREKWSDEQCTHWMMYETTSEGTPISPAFETPEDLARWLADNGASAFAGMTATYEQWLNTILSQHGAVSAVYTPSKGLLSGVEANAKG